MTYTTGAYNKCNDDEQWIRITDGCPNRCEYCYAPPKLEDYGVPQILRNKVKVMDMNLLAVNPNRLDELPTRLNKTIIHYEMICGFDYRLLNEKIATKLYKLRFGRFNRKGKWYRSVRIAWDYWLEDNIEDKVTVLKKVGFKGRQIEVFMVCDWKIPFEICVAKLYEIKKWGCLINDCWFDNVKPPKYQCNYWTLEQCKKFRAMCRKHNQLILFHGFDPESKPTPK